MTRVAFAAEVGPEVGEVVVGAPPSGRPAVADVEVDPPAELVGEGWAGVATLSRPGLV